MIASQRAREIAGGAPLTIERDNDKNPVIALREIADKTVSLDTLRDAMVKGHQRVLPPEETEEDIIELMDGEQGWVRPAESLEEMGDDLDALPDDDEDDDDAEDNEEFAEDSADQPVDFEDEK
jgi:DNA-directed RNA polymerase subunit omega